MQGSGNSEFFDTGLSKIRHEIKSQLASRGLYGSVTERSVEGSVSQAPATLIELTVKDQGVNRAFERARIEACHLRVDRGVMADITAMIDELAR